MLHIGCSIDLSYQLRLKDPPKDLSGRLHRRTYQEIFQVDYTRRTYQEIFQIASSNIPNGLYQLIGF